MSLRSIAVTRRCRRREGGSARAGPARIQLGLRENLAQFTLLVVVNAFVGAMVGIERTILPPLAEQEFHLAARFAALSFIVVFGVTKALTNYAAGQLSDRIGRKHVLVAGWIVAVPVPFLLMWAPTWNWILVANVFLGISQGLTWSTTVIMKIDLVGSQRRGFAMGLNEFAGYGALAARRSLTGWIAAGQGLRPDPFYPGVAFVAIGLTLSVFLVRETHGHVTFESTLQNAGSTPMSARDVFWRTTLTDRNLSSVTQAGLVNNLNDGMAWGLFPLLFAAAQSQPRSDWCACGHLSRHVEHRPTGHWSVVRSIRAEVADCCRHVGPGRRYRRGDRVRWIRRLCHRRRVARNRHGDGVPDAARRDR